MRAGTRIFIEACKSNKPTITLPNELFNSMAAEINDAQYANAYVSWITVWGGENTPYLRRARYMMVHGTQVLPQEPYHVVTTVGATYIYVFSKG